MARVTITTTKKYGSWLARHLAKEHPKTKGRIRVYGGKHGSTSDMMWLAIMGLILGMLIVVSLYVYNSMSSLIRGDSELVTPGSTAELILNDNDAFLPGTLDTVFAIAFFGTALVSIALAFLVRVSPVFAFITIFIMVIITVMVGALGHVWDTFRNEEVLTGTVGQLPITANVLDNYPLYLLGVWILVFFSMIFGGSVIQ